MCGWMKRIAKKWEAERLIAIDVTGAKGETVDWPRPKRKMRRAWFPTKKERARFKRRCGRAT